MIREICVRAKAASYEMGKLSAEAKNLALNKMADALEASMAEILEANRIDVQEAKNKGVRAALLDRLALDQKKIQKMANELREVAALEDPIGDSACHLDTA
jgi:glutamate-5-semialdehyde dehydrogenase